MRALIEVTPPMHPGYAPFPIHLIPGYRPRPAHLGGLGSSVATTVAAAGAAKAAAIGASDVAIAAGVGTTIAPVIGTVVGAVIGLVAGKLLNPQYLNVAQANATEATYVAAFNQYRTIAGQAAGRTFGLSTMVAVWKGAVFAGLFPLNHNQGPQCFHEGCLALSGQPQWIDGTISGNGNATFPQAYAAMQSALSMAASKAAAAAVGSRVVSTAPTVASTAAAAAINASLRSPGAAGNAKLQGWLGTMAPARARYELARRQRMGSLAAVAAGTALPAALGAASASLPGPPAVVFIDTYWMPLQQKNSPPWGVPQTALEHQILYDVADAWLATQSITTAPFVAGAAAGQYVQAPPKVVPAVASAVQNATNTAPAVVSAAAAKSTPQVIPAPLLTAKATPQVISAAGTPATATAQVIKPTVLAPTVTPSLPATPPAVASAAGTATTVASATAANLNAALASQGFTYVGATPGGLPIYSQAGSSQTWVYSNNQLIPYASVAQVAATGGAGTGVSTPATGVDPSTLSIIQAALAQGMSAQQAADAAAANLTAQGVPVTSTVQDQLLAAATTPPAPASSSAGLLILGGAALLLLFMSS